MTFDELLETPINEIASKNLNILNGSEAICTYEIDGIKIKGLDVNATVILYYDVLCPNRINAALCKIYLKDIPILKRMTLKKYLQHKDYKVTSENKNGYAKVTLVHNKVLT